MRRIASSLLGRQALFSSIFALTVLLILLAQIRVPLALIAASRIEIVGIARIADAHRLLETIALAEVRGRPLSRTDATVAPVLASFVDANAPYLAERDIFGRALAAAQMHPRAAGALPRLATATAVLIVKLSDASRLTYDEDVDAINYGDLLSTQLPRLVDRASHAAAIAARRSTRSTLAERLSIARLAGQSDISWLAAENDFDLGSAATSIGTERLARARATQARAFATLLAGLDAIAKPPRNERAAQVRRAGTMFVRASAAYVSAIQDALDEIVARRIARQHGSIALIVVLCIVTLALGILAEFSRRRSTRQQLKLRIETDRARAFEFELARQRVDRARVLNEAQFRTIFDNSPLGIATIDAHGAFVERNRAMVEMSGEPLDLFDDAFDARAYGEVVAGSAPPYQIERRVVGADGVRWIELTVFPICISDGESIAAIAMIADVTERKVLAERLRYDAAHDALTGLASRIAFLNDVAISIEAARGDRRACRAIMLIDLDRFKFVNDTFGHASGDDVLIEVAGRLRGASRARDIVARLHGDEFALLVTLDDRRELATYAQRLQEALRLPVRIGGQSVGIDSSIGICTIVGAGVPETLMHDADTAMYRAKRSGRGRYVIFDEALREASVRYGRLASEMIAGLEAGDFRVEYQPIVALEETRIDGFEALLRWRHPQFGEISPGEFIPIAEEMGSIGALGSFILGEATRQAVRFNSDRGDLPRLAMSVNLSPRQLVEGIVAEVEQHLRDTGLPGHELILEITESALLESGPDVSDILQRLRATGARLCLDDFGTGYSSLRYLQQFPIDELKIDRSFVAAVDGDLASEPIARMLLGLAKALGIGVVAEGIETTRQRDRLLTLGCRLGQGYLFSKPRAARDFALATGLGLPVAEATLEGVGAV